MKLTFVFDDDSCTFVSRNANLCNTVTKVFSTTQARDGDVYELTFFRREREGFQAITLERYANCWFWEANELMSLFLPSVDTFLDKLFGSQRGKYTIYAKFAKRAPSKRKA